MGVEVVIGRVVKGSFETVLTTTGCNLVRKPFGVRLMG